MIMIYQSLHVRKDFSALVKHAMKHTDDTEHLTEILQHYYDLACQAAIPKRRRNKRRYMKMADKNGKEVIVSVRLNGRQPKPKTQNDAGGNCRYPTGFISPCCNSCACKLVVFAMDDPKTLETMGKHMAPFVARFAFCKQPLCGSCDILL